VFIKKFCRYGVDVIASAIKEFKKKIKRLEVLDRLAGMTDAVDKYIELSTLYRWKKKFSNIL
jgi:predicted translin family RNA/ssDNA-binding protein